MRGRGPGTHAGRARACCDRPKTSVASFQAASFRCRLGPLGAPKLTLLPPRGVVLSARRKPPNCGGLAASGKRPPNGHAWLLLRGPAQRLLSMPPLLRALVMEDPADSARRPPSAPAASPPSAQLDRSLSDSLRSVPAVERPPAERPPTERRGNLGCASAKTSLSKLLELGRGLKAAAAAACSSSALRGGASGIGVEPLTAFAHGLAHQDVALNGPGTRPMSEANSLQCRGRFDDAIEPYDAIKTSGEEERMSG